MSSLVPKLRFKEFSGEWVSKKLKEITEYVDYRGIAPIKTDDGYFLVTAKNIKKGYIDYKISKEYVGLDNYLNVMRKGLPEIGDVLFTTEAPMGNVAQVDNKNIALAQRVIKFRGNNLLKNDFLKYYMISSQFQKLLYSHAFGSTVLGIQGKILHNLNLIIPTPKEQQKIANCLSSLDNLIESQNKKVEALKKHKKALMQELFPSDGEKIPKLRFDDFSGEWEKKAISDLANRYDNLRIPITASNRIEGAIPYYGANGIQSYIQGYTHNGEFILVAEDGANDLQNYPVQYVNGKIWVNNHAHVLQGKKEISNNHFLMYALKNIDIEPYLVGGGRAKLNAHIMMKISFLIPKLKEQQKIANCLSSLDKLIESQNKKIKTLKKHKKGLMQKLFVSSEERK